MRTFILLKDLPNVKAGAEYKSEGFGPYYLQGVSDDETDYWSRRHVEENPEWFQEVEVNKTYTPKIQPPAELNNKEAEEEMADLLENIERSRNNYKDIEKTGWFVRGAVNTFDARFYGRVPQERIDAFKKEYLEKTNLFFPQPPASSVEKEVNEELEKKSFPAGRSISFLSLDGIKFSMELISLGNPDTIEKIRKIVEEVCDKPKVKPSRTYHTSDFTITTRGEEIVERLIKLGVLPEEKDIINATPQPPAELDGKEADVFAHDKKEGCVIDFTGYAKGEVAETETMKTALEAIKTIVDIYERNKIIKP